MSNLEMNLSTMNSPEVKNSKLEAPALLQSSGAGRLDFFLSPEILKLGKSNPRVKMFFGDKIQDINKAKKAQKIYKKEREWLVRIIKQKINYA